jgi:hypothetical protein
VSGGFWDALLGRNRLKQPDLDRVFGLVAAATTLETELGVRGAGRGGLCLKPVAGGGFRMTDRELRDLVALAAKDLHAEAAISDDEFGYRWVVFEDSQLPDLVNLVHLAASTLHGQGFGDHLLAAVFRFAADAGPLYLVYNYKRGNFYPFAPRAGQDRDLKLEFEASGVLAGELAVEKDTGRWYPLWNCPV